MKFIKKCYIKIKDFLFPIGTKRRRLLDLFYLSINYIKNYGFVSFLKKVKTIFLRKFFSLFTPKVPNIYKINRNPYVKIDKPLFLPYIDIIIVTYNSDKYINNCINSLINIEYDLKKITLIIIDNNSKDSTKNKINEIFIKNKFIFNDIKIKFNEKNIGFGAGINYGSKLSNSEYLFILNPDTIVDKYCLLNLIKYAINDKYCAIWEARQLPFEHPKFYDPLTLETIWSSAAAMLIKREIFERVKGFDENYFLYVEDVDLSFKVRNLGYCCRYIPEAIVYHFTKDKSKKIEEKVLYYSIRNNLYLRWKFLSFKEIIKGYIFLIFLFRKDKKLKNIIYSILVSHFRMIFNGINYGFKNRNIRKNLKISSFIWNFEYEKYGGWFFNYNIHNPKHLISIILFIIELDTLTLKLLRETIQSIYNQTYKNLEIILLTNNNIINNINLNYKNFEKVAIKEILLTKTMDILSYDILNKVFNILKGDLLTILNNKILLYNTHFDMLLHSFNIKNDSKILYSKGLLSKIIIKRKKEEDYFYKSIEIKKDPNILINNIINDNLILSFKTIQESLLLLNKNSVSIEPSGIMIQQINNKSIYKIDYITFEDRQLFFKKR